MKKIGLLILTLCLALSIAGCSSYMNKSYTYDVDTGDSIKVTVNIKDDFDIVNEVEGSVGIFTILKDDEPMCIGGFLPADDFDSLKELAAATYDDYDESVTENGNEYFYVYDSNKEMAYYEIMVKDSDTILVLQGEDESNVTECFERVTVSYGEE